VSAVVDERAAAVAHVVRGGVVESAHRGHAVVLAPGGGEVLRAGDPGAVVLARSALKPVQAVAMLRAGLDLDGELLALACASHSGEPAHRDGVRRILATAGLTEADLRNTPAAALADPAGPPSSITQNCSGKHAAMLATCVAAGWDVRTHLRPDHPLQRAVRAAVAELTGDGDPVHTTVDGCGAPLFSCTPDGLARAYARIATAPPGTPEHRVAAAVRAHPWWLGGSDRFVTRLIGRVPGLVAKEGAEGVFAAALPDGGALALKIVDGSARPVPALVTAALAALGADVPEAAGRVDVLGLGAPPGTVRALLPVPGVASS
jgi:L-asparaginase II